MGLKLATLLLFLSLLNISQANPAKDDSEKHLANSPAKPIAANQDGHQLAKREAGKEGRKRSCQGKGWVILSLSICVSTFLDFSDVFSHCLNFRCSKKKTPKKAKKDKKVGQKPKNNEKKRKSLKRNRLQRRKKKTDDTEKKAKPGKKSKKRKGGKKKKSEKKSSKEKKQKKGSRKRTGSSRSKVGTSNGRQITGNATSCAMKLVNTI